MVIIFILLSLMIIPALYLLLGLQIISLGDYVRSDFEKPFQLILDLDRYREFPEFFYLIVFLIVLTILSFLWISIIGNKTSKQRALFLSQKERRNSSHLASKHEAKKMRQRIEFDVNGKNLEDHTILGKLDLLFDKPKRIYNTFLSLLKIKDIHKLNTLMKWKIGKHTTHRRGGPPIVTGKNAVWVDASDYNTMIIGVTRAGKTWLIIDILIQLLRMGGESMIVMDVKGELTKLHLQSLKDDDYDTYVVDFTDPNRSVCWNPFGIIIRKHRQSYEKYKEELNRDENKEIIKEINVNKLMIQKLEKKDDQNSDILRQINELQMNIEKLSEMLPKPDYSEAQELATDIAIRLCCDDDSKDPFWPDSASELLEGYINFLLEEKVPDGKGAWTFLSDEMINMRSIKALHDQGKTKIDPKVYDGCTTLLQYYLSHYRKPTDMSVIKLGEYSVMPENTKGSISSVFSNKIRYFISNENILRMTSRSDFDLKQLGERKTAIFITVHDEKGTYHKLPSILISQTYEELIKTARGESALRLKVPVYVVWDEFANGAPWKNIVNALTAGLSRGVRFALAIQDLGQIKKIYGEMASTIWSNCQNTYYLLAGENSTLEEISKTCGNEIRWDADKRCKVKEPVLTTDALRKLSFGQAVIISHRKNPFLTWLRPFDQYGFSLPETPDLPLRKLPDPDIYDIQKVFEEHQKTNHVTGKTAEINDEAAKKEKESLETIEEYVKEGDDLGLNEN